jgi:hypothetical protein
MKQLFFVMLLGVFLPQSITAQANTSVDEVIKTSFAGVKTIEPKQLILTQEQFSQVQSKAKTAVKTKIYRYYDIKNERGRLGVAVLVAREVRSKKATVLYAFEPNGTLRFTEIMAFGEPPEYIPGKTWMTQLQNKESSALLAIGKDIPTVSGSTLSARCVTEGARIARAIYEITLK